MKHKISEAMEQISDQHIAEAAHGKKKSRRPAWLSAAAAILVVVLTIVIFGQPMALSASAVEEAEYPKYEPFVLQQDDMELMDSFFHQAISGTLSNLEGENGAFSPINLMMALSALAELSSGQAQQQILSALNASSMEALRSRANAIWRASYLDNGNQLMLANSLWLDNSVDFNPEVMDLLAQNYYTSSYRCDLDSRKASQLISQWLNGQTGNLLKKETTQIQHTPDTLLALYATVYFQAKWSHEFSAGQNTDGIFHAPGGDQAVTFMNKSKMQSEYYWAEDFGAICLWLKGNSTMWLFLPDEDKTVDDILDSQDYLDILYGNSEDHKYMFVNLSIPKFDIRQSCDLASQLQSMGITDVFDPAAGAFRNSVYRSDVWLTSANQATRVAIDEKGVTAASYIEFPGAGAAAPPEEEIDFILDRPFFFVIMHESSLPLFAGVVNEP